MHKQYHISKTYVKKIDLTPPLDPTTATETTEKPFPAARQDPRQTLDINFLSILYLK